MNSEIFRKGVKITLNMILVLFFSMSVYYVTDSEVPVKEEEKKRTSASKKHVNQSG